MTLDPHLWTQAATPVRHLYISNDTMNALRGAGVLTVGALLKLNAGGLRRIEGIGDMQVVQIREALERIGVNVGGLS